MNEIKKLGFASDYMEGMHPAILERLAETNLLQTTGYGRDEFCESARRKIREACACPDAAVEFLVGGTQANLICIGAMLKPWQGVLAAVTGHVAGHEAGAIEHTGHKVLTLPHSYGKIAAADVREWCRRFYADANREHMVEPGMVYISQPTEYGTLYTLEELEALRKVCDEFCLKLYLDGARLAYALACAENDAALPDLARLCDAFYIGGTKCGAMFGEAVVAPNPQTIPHFFTIIKQNGALLAKGRMLGLQFDVLFTDGLYEAVGRPSIQAAAELRGILTRKGYRFFFETPTNQIFVILENAQMAKLAEAVDFGFWEEYDASHTVVRFATSWATTPEAVRALSEIL